MSNKRKSSKIGRNGRSSKRGKSDTSEKAPRVKGVNRKTKTAVRAQRAGYDNSGLKALIAMLMGILMLAVLVGGLILGKTLAGVISGDSVTTIDGYGGDSSARGDGDASSSDGGSSQGGGDTGRGDDTTGQSLTPEDVVILGLRWAKAQRPVAHQGRKLIALTFDDGPSGATTPWLLDILKEKNVKATFFELGVLVNANPAITQRALAEGHEVGSHTMNHTNLSYSTAEAIKTEVAAVNEIFRNATGKNYAIMRPPYGNGINRPEVQQNIAAPMFYWSVDTLDWKYRDPARVRQNAVSASYDGAIILMHDIHATTVQAVPGIIDDLRARGYDFVTVSELARARGVKLEAGKTYYDFKP